MIFVGASVIAVFILVPLLLLKYPHHHRHLLHPHHHRHLLHPHHHRHLLHPHHHRHLLHPHHHRHLHLQQIRLLLLLVVLTLGHLLHPHHHRHLHLQQIRLLLLLVVLTLGLLLVLLLTGMNRVSVLQLAVMVVNCQILT